MRKSHDIMKKISMILVALLSINYSLKASAFWGDGKPKNYDECIINGVEKIQTTAAAYLLKSSCNNLFPPVKATKKELEKIKLKAFNSSYYVVNNTNKTIKSFTIKLLVFGKNNQNLAQHTEQFKVTIPPGNKEKISFNPTKNFIAISNGAEKHHVDVEFLEAYYQ